MCPNYNDCLTCDNLLKCPYGLVPTTPVCDEFQCCLESCNKSICITYEEEIELYRGE